jgi:hypothetical protein
VSHLTPGQAELLIEIYRHPERGPAEHSRATGKDSGWVNKLIWGLERLGLAKRWTPRWRAPGSRTLRLIRPLHRALLVRQGSAVVFGDDGRRHIFPVEPRWTAKTLAAAPLLCGHRVLVLYRRDDEA